MAQFTIRCKCGEQFHVDETIVGGKLKCRCGRTLKVRRRRRTLGTRVSEAVSRTAAAAGFWIRRRTTTRVIAPIRVSTRGARAVAILSWSYVGAVSLVALLMWGFGDRWWPATILLFLGRWVFLLPLLALVPAALFLSRRQLLPLALGALVVAIPIMGFRTGWRRMLSSPSGAHVRVVTFNADGGIDLARRLPSTLAAWDAQVVAFQECADSLAAATRVISGWYHHDHAGLCLLSRFPIRDSAVMDRRALEAVRNSGASIGGAGAVIRYTLETPQGVIQLTNLHLETPRKGFELLMAGDLNGLRQNTTLRDIEADLARRWVSQGVVGTTTPYLVAGDFNTPVESRIFRSHWDDLSDAFSRVGFGLGMTKYNGWIQVRIDHVLVGPWWHVDRIATGADEGSDHRPLIAELTLLPQR